MGNKTKIWIRPKVEEVSTESLMMFFAECLKKYCSDRQGVNACEGCPLHQKNVGCRLGGQIPEEWRVGK